jgi:4-amino-4-deoxychorismate lyase
MESWLVDGAPDRGIATGDRGLAYGDGLFETIAWRGGEARFAALHWERLAEGCRRLGLPPPPVAEIERDMRRLAGGSALGTAKVILTRGAGARGYLPPPEPRPTRLVAFAAEHEPAVRAAARCRSCATFAARNPTLAGLKTLNRLDSVLARAETGAAGMDEGLMWDDAGLLVGGTMSNVFLVTDGRLLTPRLDRAGVRGVMRRVVLEEAAAVGAAVAEVPVDRAMLDRCHAAFLTNARLGLWPVGEVDGRTLDAGDPVLRAVGRRLATRGVGPWG